MYEAHEPPSQPGTACRLPESVEAVSADFFFFFSNAPEKFRTRASTPPKVGYARGCLSFVVG